MPEFSARLYLITPVVHDASAFEGSLAQALGTGDVACVLLRTDPGASKEKRLAVVRSLAPAVQSGGTALLVEGDLAASAADLQIDGLHAEGGRDDLTLVLRSAKPDRIVGVGRLSGRDEAMVAGESGADYLMFGDPDAEGHVSTFEQRLDQVAWWAEIFQVPCVAFAQALGEVEGFAEAGAEFVALSDAVWCDGRQPAAAVLEALKSLAEGSRRLVARTGWATA